MGNLKNSSNNTNKILRDTKAGHYEPSLLGLIKGLIYPRISIAPNVLDVERPTVLDISFYQIQANFATMLNNGVSGVIIRAGQNNWPDSSAFTFMTNATKEGMPFGSYFFYDSRRQPREQAELWASVIDRFDTKLWCWADYEENYGGAYGGWRSFYDFLEACKAIMPNRKFGIYTGYYYWIEHSPNPITQRASLDYFAQYPLWLAWYTNDSSIVRIPAPWKEMVFWQHSASGDGDKYGVGSREVDMNKFMLGSHREFNGLFNLDGSVPPPPPPVQGEVGMFKVISEAYNMSLREDRNVSAARKATVLQDTEMIADRIEPQNSGGMDGDKWAHIPNIVIDGLAYEGWVAVIHNGVEYCTYTQIPDATELPSTLYIATKEDMSDKVKYVKEA